MLHSTPCNSCDSQCHPPLSRRKVGRCSWPCPGPQQRDKAGIGGILEEGTAGPDPRLDIPPCWVPAHLFSSARGRWCWGGRWGLPPGCSGTCNRPPRPGTSSTRWPPLQRERAPLQSHQDQEKRGEQPHTHAHRAGPTGDTPHVSAPSSASPGTFLQLFHHLDLEVARAAVPFRVACSPGLAANAVPDALAHSLEALSREGRWDGQETAHGEQGTTSPPKGRAADAMLHPHPSSRARSKRGITENKQLTRDL